LEEHHYPHERVLPIYVANKSLPRACRIMDAFLRGIDAFGGAIELNGDCMRNPELYVVLHHFRFRFRLQEMKTAAKVDVPYDPPRLELTIEFIDPESRRRTRTQSYTDTSESTVEQGLGNAFLYILESVDQRHGEYLLKMREQHRAWEEELRRMEIEKRIDQEKLKVRVLERMVDDWNRAKCIREMIERVKETLVESGGGETNSALAQWMDWASLKADWLDPTTEHIDEILGAREDFLLKLLNSSNDSLPRASSSRYDAYTPNIPRGYYINRHNQGK